MVVVNCLDFFFTLLTIITIGLAVWHVFDENVGTELDWLVAIIFGIMTIGYNVVVRYTIDITWNRLNTVNITIVYMIAHFLVIKKMVKDSQYESGTENKVVAGYSKMSS